MRQRITLFLKEGTSLVVVSGMSSKTRNDETWITIDDYDSQSLEVARQVGTGMFTIRIDHFVHDDYVCNLLLDDLVIDVKPDVNNVARGPHQPCSPDCFTHAMVDDSRRAFPRSVLQADHDYRELRTGEF